MPRAWSAKRERQYRHIKDEQLKDGKSEKKAEEIAARTVNKTRAQKGEAKTASKSSLNDMSPRGAAVCARTARVRVGVRRNSSTARPGARASRAVPR